MKPMNIMNPLSSAENSRLLSGKNNGAPAAPVTVTYTFSIEVFRFTAFVAFLSLIAIGKIVSDLLVFEPEVPGTTVLGMIPSGSQDVTKTKIYEIFGFNHLCNVVDFNPSKEIAAIMIAFYVFPFNCFLVLSYFRSKLSYLNGDISKGLYTYSTIITPICILFTSIIHLWFVNSPQDERKDGGYGFIGHYLPYMAFQCTLGLVSIQQLLYDISLNKIPFGVTKQVAKIYVGFVILLTITCQILVLSILMKNPILNSKDNLTHRKIFQILGDLYSVTALVGPAIFSFWAIKNDDTNTFTLGHQGIEGAPKILVSTGGGGGGCRSKYENIHEAAGLAV